VVDDRTKHQIVVMQSLSVELNLESQNGIRICGVVRKNATRHRLYLGLVTDGNKNDWKVGFRNEVIIFVQ
jgi:hypothetical protein